MTFKDTPLQHWRVFIHDIKTRSGKHRHQGGLVIYVLEGKGYSVVDGERKDWEKGDLVLLPMKPEGVEHQHFNLDPAEPAHLGGVHQHPDPGISSPRICSRPRTRRTSRSSAHPRHAPRRRGIQ